MSFSLAITNRKKDKTDTWANLTPCLYGAGPEIGNGKGRGMEVSWAIVVQAIERNHPPEASVTGAWKALGANPPKTCCFQIP